MDRRREEAPWHEERHERAPTLVQRAVDVIRSQFALALDPVPQQEHEVGRTLNTLDTRGRQLMRTDPRITHRRQDQIRPPRPHLVLDPPDQFEDCPFDLVNEIRVIPKGYTPPTGTLGCGRVQDRSTSCPQVYSTELSGLRKPAQAFPIQFEYLRNDPAQERGTPVEDLLTVPLDQANPEKTVQIGSTLQDP
ncbi:hypothetical protein NE237_010556 [Protea cynaroides]|uniref:Uncharacterized protein n=1 Tax=Protea cynaroides TaxID=273540 RepID=A0A9Q0L0V0_9MAGN|nr:hypothetical protein NE237_010556 [Protea cynaroides]